MSATWEAGLRLAQSGHADAAEAFCREALAATPDDAMLWQVRGVAAYQRNDLGAARDHFARVVELDPENLDGQNNLAEALKRLARYGDAIPVYERALAINPDNPVTLVNYCHALLESGRNGEAVRAARRALEKRPDWVAALQNLSLALWAAGHVGEAIGIVRRAVEIEPESRVASNLLMFLQYSAEHSEDALLAAAREWGATVLCPPVETPDVATPARLRIGYVSSDLRDHPVGYGMERVLAGHDRARVEVFLYGTGPVQDATTERLKAYADGWRDLAAEDDETAARRIAEDGIHVLIDLSGHTAFHRLGIFARRAAPVQASWFGYFATTGLPQMDFVLRDRAQIPTEEESFYTERVWRIEDAAFGYEPVAGCPEISPLPARRNGHITFGCFVNPAKVSDAAIAAWVGTLLAVPGSRMLFDRKGFDDPLARDRVRTEFARHGVDAERLDFGASRGHLAYMARYAEVDLVLDTFPCNGATTTYEALWMGVPVVSRRWPRMVGHFAESILAPLGYADWVANDDRGLVERAVALADDLDALADLRRTLRTRMRDSSLCRGGDCARGLEDAYEGMWRARHGSGSPSAGAMTEYARFGIEAFVSGDTILAERVFRRATNLAPGRADAHHDLGELLRATGRPEEAISPLRKALALSPDHPGANGSLGAVLASLEFDDEAISHLERASPEDGEAWLARVAPLARGGRIAEAFDAFERGAAQAPALVGERGAAIFAALGDALVGLGRFEEAVVCFVEGAKFDVSPSRIHAEASRRMAESLARSGHRDEAARWAELGPQKQAA